MSEPISGLWAVYLTEYPDEGSALIEAKDAKEAIRISRLGDLESCDGPWEAEPAAALTAEAMTPEAMATRIATGEADASGTIEGRWLANVACGQAMEIERLRAEVQWFREYVEDAAALTDETKTPAPERSPRMTEAELCENERLALTIAGGPKLGAEVAALIHSARCALAAEARRARAAEGALIKVAQDLDAEIKSIAREREAVRAESASRLQALNEKAEEARREWQRAENAEAERDAAQKEAERLRADTLAEVAGNAETWAERARLGDDVSPFTTGAIAALEEFAAALRARAELAAPKKEARRE